MATPPDFSVGQVLTAAHMDAVGLWLVASGTLSSTVKNFENVFTSDYTNYRIVIDSVSFNDTGFLNYRLLNNSTAAATSDYFWAMTGVKVTAAAANDANSAQNRGYLGVGNIGANNLVIGGCSWDIYGPLLAQRTLMTGIGVGVTTDYFSLSGMNVYNSTNAYNGIQFLTGSATTFSGNVRIYGYRK